MITVEIDSQSGFCGGVIRAISNAESFLAAQPSDKKRLYSLGDIVHNEAELERLSSLGLVSIDYSDLDEIPGAHGETLLIRAHGEQPQTYSKLNQLGFDVIDCTCPVVLNLQKSIKMAYDRIHPEGGQIVLFGKIGHPEVLGLVGQVAGDAFVVENCDQLKALIADGSLHTDHKIAVFSQTTKSPAGYEELCSILRSEVKDESLLEVNNTICRQVAFRQSQLDEFARSHDIIIFVSGKASSNGQVLCERCRSLNIRTYHIGGVSDIHADWFRPDDSVGVCGATSTPKWLLENVAKHISSIVK